MNMNHITTANATFQITGVQLEEGTVATPFEFIDYATQLQLCRRYYAEFQPTGQEQIYIETGNNNTHSFWNAPIPPGMRATPTAILNGTWTGGGTAGRGWSRGGSSSRSIAAGCSWFPAGGNRRTTLPASGGRAKDHHNIGEDGHGGGGGGL